MDDKRIKFTSKIRRGLSLVREIALDSFNQNKPPSETVVATWPKYKQDEFNAAMDWIDQNAREREGVAVVA